MKKLYILLSLFCFSAIAGSAQSTGMTVEVFAVHDGIVGDYDLTGFTTYRVYLNTTNSEDKLSAIYGVIGTDDNPDDEDISFTATGECFEHPLGGPSGNDGSCDLYPFMPALEYDTYLTIGVTSSCDDGGVMIATTLPAEVPDELCGLWVDDGAWFALATQTNGIAGQDNKVLIAQFTTNGAFSFSACFQEFVNGDQSEQAFNCHSIENVLGGCTDPNAPNFNAEANVDDGTCLDPVIAGCMDEEACNYMADATADDGTCTYPGCMDLTACNYDADAGCENNEICTYLTLYAIEGSDEVVEQTIETYQYEETPESVYSWVVDGGTVSSGQGTSNVSILWGDQGDGAITVTETSGDGCIGAPIELQVTINSSVNVEETGAFELAVYPVPTQNILFIDVPQTFIGASYFISDLSGRSLSPEVIFTDARTEIDVRELSTGVYFLIVSNADERNTLRFVVQR